MVIIILTGYELPFDWEDYLQRQDAMPAPHHLFTEVTLVILASCFVILNYTYRVIITVIGEGILQNKIYIEV